MHDYRIGAHPEDTAPGWEHPDVRRVAAKDPDSPRWLFAQLAHDDDERVRAAVASNIACPTRVMAGLVFDEHDEVRMAVAGNRLTPDELLGLLLDDDVALVRAVAANQLRARHVDSTPRRLPTDWRA